MILMWNCMTRRSSIDQLGLHNFELGADIILIAYDDSKTDSTGERTHPKNCYVNPINPNICLFLSLSIWLVLFPEQFGSTDSLFLKRRGFNLGTASKRFLHT